MTYDHIYLWEKGGDTTMENGTCSCKKCNKTRGSIEFDEWLETSYYKRVSQNISGSDRATNIALSRRYKNFPLRVSKRTR